MRRGIDVSRWNEIRDYDALRQAGVEYAIVKVNNAGNVADKRFHEHMAGFKAANIPVIAGYNYCYANTKEKALRASASFVELAAPQGISQMILDLEDASIRGLGSGILDIINIYRHTAEQAEMRFAIYTGASFYTPCLKKYMSELAEIPFWWARYPSVSEKSIADNIPVTKNLPKNLELSGWQYSSKGVLPGARGYVDLNVWFENESFKNMLEEIPFEYNPYTEPTGNVTTGAMGNDANWALWYLWRFGKLVDKEGLPDATQIDGYLTDADVALIKEVQQLLGLTADGIVGKRTKSIWKKLC